MDENLRQMIKAAQENAVNIEDVERYLIGDVAARAGKDFINGGMKNELLFPYGYTPNTTAFIDSRVNVPIGDHVESPKEVLLPRDAEGKRKTSTNPKDVTAASGKNVQNLLSGKEGWLSDWETYKAALKQRKQDAINAGALTAGGTTAIASYLGLGLIPRMRRYKVIRAILGLAGGIGAGWAYKEMADPSIYAGYDLEKIKENLNKDAPLAAKLVKTKNPDAGTLPKIDRVVLPEDPDRESRKALRSNIKRYGTDAAVGAAAGLGTYAITDLIPQLKNKKALKMLLASGIGVGAGALTDLAARKG